MLIKLGWSLAFLAGLYFIVLGLLYIFQDRLLFFPQKEKIAVPSDFKDRIEILTLDAGEAKGLQSWYIPADGNKETIAFFHGNAANHLANLYRGSPYIEQGYGFVSIGYRGYNGHAGKPGEKAFYEDSRAFIDLLLQENNLDAENLIFFGESIGGGVATQMAVDYPQASALIVFSTFTSAAMLAQEKYPVFPAGLLLRHKFDNESKAAGLRMPLLVIHGDQDADIPFQHGQRLYETASEEKALVKIEGGTHNNIRNEHVVGSVLEFLQQK